MKKKTIITLVIVIVVLALAVAGILLLDNYYKPVLISAIDNSFEITIPGSVKFKKKEATTLDYKLDFYCVKDQMFFSSFAIEDVSTINLVEAITKEKDSLPGIRQGVKDISEVSKMTIKDYDVQKYSYVYYDANFSSDIYAEIVWIKTNKRIYVLDLEVVLKNKDKYIPIFSTIEQSFIEK